MSDKSCEKIFDLYKSCIRNIHIATSYEVNQCSIIWNSLLKCHCKEKKEIKQTINYK